MPNDTKITNIRYLGTNGSIKTMIDDIQNGLEEIGFEQVSYANFLESARALRLYIGYDQLEMGVFVINAAYSTNIKKPIIATSDEGRTEVACLGHLAIHLADETTLNHIDEVIDPYSLGA